MNEDVKGPLIMIFRNEQTGEPNVVVRMHKDSVARLQELFKKADEDGYLFFDQPQASKMLRTFDELFKALGMLKEGGG